MIFLMLHCHAARRDGGAALQPAQVAGGVASVRSTCAGRRRHARRPETRTGPAAATPVAILAAILFNVPVVDDEALAQQPDPPSPPAITEIDVAVYYNAETREVVDDDYWSDNIDALIDLMVAETNAAFDRSGAHVRVRLVDRGEADYEYFGDFFREDWPELRDAVGADIGVVITNNPFGCGGAAGSQAWVHYACGGAAFAHEVGHHLGLMHDRYTDCPNLCWSSNPYGYGYVNQRAFEPRAPDESRWTTIMAYGGQCREVGDFWCDTAMYFSNPALTLRGDPLGVPGDHYTTDRDGPADAVRRINDVREFTAARRERVDPPLGIGRKLWFEAESYEAVEGGDTALVRVGIHPPRRDSRITVGLRTTSGAGVADGDHTGIPWAVWFAPGQRYATFTVTAADDGHVEAPETLRIAFDSSWWTSPSQYPPWRASTTVTLRDNDGPNRPPLAVGTLAARRLRAPDGAVAVDVSHAFRDPDNDVLTYGVASSAPAVVTATVAGATVTLTPVAAGPGVPEGTAAIAVTATDAAGSNTTATQRFTVTVPNEGPAPLGTLADRTLRIEDGAVAIDLAAAFRDGDGDVLTYAAVSSPAGVAAVSVSDSELTVRPRAAGTAAITVTATDAAGSNTTATQRFTVTVPNRAPVAVGALAERRPRIEDGPVVVDVAGAFRDPDGDALDYRAVSSSSAIATVEVAGSAVTVTPQAVGAATVTVTATDGGGSRETATQTFRVTVLPEGTGDFDKDDDGLIDIRALAQLDAMRHDTDGDGAATESGAAAYAAAFPDRIAGMGCPQAGCTGYELLADLDFDTDGNGVVDAGDAWWRNGAGWRPIGEPDDPYQATFAGNGHTIARLLVGGRRSRAGLFGVVGATGVIRNVGLIDVDVTGRTAAGGLAGDNGGAIAASHAGGRVTASSGVGAAGGLVGRNHDGGRIDVSHATARVTSHGYGQAGGLVGVQSAARITASYATGRVTGAAAGGLVGQNTFSGQITASYATGRVTATEDAGGLVGYQTTGRATASYWDAWTSGRARGAGRAGEGHSTPALQEPAGYTGLYETWNVDVNGDGAPDAPWTFESGAYPALAVDFDGDGRATWEEFGRQVRQGPTLANPTAADGAPVNLTWTAVDASHWTPAPRVSYAVYRTAGGTVTLLADDVDGLAYTDDGVDAGAEYAYQVAARLAGGEPSRSRLAVLNAPLPNAEPVAVGSLPARRLRIADGAATVDVSGAFHDPDGDGLTWTASSSAPHVATVSVSGSMVTVTPVSPGVTTVTVTATDAAGASATQSFVVTVPGVDYDLDDDGLIEIATLVQLDAVRHDLDGDGVPIGAGWAAYTAAFPDAATRKGCPAGGCSGYELVADLDFDTNGNGAADAGDDWWNDGAGWRPIGGDSSNSQHRFDGTFAGNGHTIGGLYIDRDRRLGLFGMTDTSGVIRDVGLVGVELTGRIYVGGLVGFNLGTIRGSYATGRVSGTFAGGLAGENRGRIRASYAMVRVTSDGNAGGLVGYTRYGSIRAAYATGGVTGGADVGGLVGDNNDGAITASYATGRVSGSTNAGGLVGANDGGRITASYWDTGTSGHVAGEADAGSGSTTAALQEATGYSGLYESWNVSLDWDGVADAPWTFGTGAQYPALVVDFDGDGQATWQEFGRQVREGPTLTAPAPAAGEPVELTWTAVDASHWTPAPRVTYAVYRTAGGTVTLLADEVDGLAYTDGSLERGVEYTYQVAALVAGGEAARSGWAPLTVQTPPNRGPEAVGALGALRLRIADGAATVDVSGAFLDPDGNALTYAASSSAPGVATVAMALGSSAGAGGPARSTLTLTPLAAGETTVTVTATDAGGSAGTAAQSFTVTVTEEPVDLDYDVDVDGLIEIATLAQLDAVRHDLDGDGVPPGAGSAAASYAAAFPDAAEGMGCPAGGCLGYELAADLDFDTDGSGAADAGDAFWNGGAGWRPLGAFDAPFTALFSGNGRTVSHLFVAGGDNAGLFGMSSGVIRGVGMVAAEVAGNQCAGALVGLNGGRVEASWSTGAVTGDSCVGGLVGVNGLWVRQGGTFRPLAGFVSASWSAAAATAERWVGGLVGYNNGTVAASYAAGAVMATTAGSGAGGLVGRMGFGENRITASYATGAVSGAGGAVGGLVGYDTRNDRVEASYWDTETSGVTRGGGGSGRTTAALQEPTGYTGLYAAWDVDVDGDGVSDAPWDFGTSSTYPALSVDADGDGAATWRELGSQGRTLPRTAASGAGAWSGGSTARARAGGTAARGQAWPAFTDDPLVPGVTPVRAVHLLELRARIDGVRRRAGLPAFGWTDAMVVPGATPARALHLTELRAALDEAYAAAGRAAPAYSDAVVTAGVTAIKAVHLAELRATVLALEGGPVRTEP